MMVRSTGRFPFFFLLFLSIWNVYGEKVADPLHLRWDWDAIDTTQVAFPRNFVWMVGSSEYQVSGSFAAPHSNWAHWELQEGLAPSRIACDSWDRYREDIALMKRLGVTAYRFSVDWSIVEPAPGLINQEAIKHYSDVCDELRKAGIKPMVTLHHFSHPMWFESLGGFEKQENIPLFVNFCSIIYRELGDRVEWWCTINEPTVYVLEGYLLGAFPPGYKWACRTAGRVLHNLLRAHVAVYLELKMIYAEQAKFGLKLEKEPSVGLAHQYLQFEPYHGILHPAALMERIFASTLSAWCNDSVINFFCTGVFNFPMPLITSWNLGKDVAKTHTERKALIEQAKAEVEYAPMLKDSLDWIGINYYSHVFFKGSLSAQEADWSGCYPGDIQTDMPYTMYAEGLYLALKRVSEIGKPIYITENGIADARDLNRDTWIRRHLYAASKAIADGCDLRGFCYWSLLDNYEWNRGYVMRFGLYEFDAEAYFLEKMKNPFALRSCKLRKGSQWFVDVVRGYAAGKFQLKSAASDACKIEEEPNGAMSAVVSGG